MIIVPPTKAVDWDSGNAKSLREFLETPTGQLMLQHLSFSLPDAYDGPNGNQMIAAAKKIEGYQEAISTLVNLTKEQPIQAQADEQYPDLNDDSKWTDLQKKK